MTHIIRVALFIVLAGLASSPVYATDYYVAKTGNDAVSCETSSTIGTPQLTIVAGVACLSAGDTLYVRTGNYGEEILSANIASGVSWSNYIRVAAYNGEVVTMIGGGGRDSILFLDGSEAFIEFDGINMNGADTDIRTVAFTNTVNNIRLKNAEMIGSKNNGGCATICGGDYITMDNLSIHGGAENMGTCYPPTPCANYGWYSGGSNNILENSDIYDQKSIMVQIYNGTTSDNIIRNNIFYGMTRPSSTDPSADLAGILIAGSRNLVYNNKFVNLGVSGSHQDTAWVIVYSGDSNKVYNNTFANNYGKAIRVLGGVTNTVIKNNIIYNSERTAISDAGTNTTASTNPTNNPSFVNAAGGDYSLQTGSSAIDTGETLSDVPLDYDGVMRPQGAFYDIGAFEFLSEENLPDNVPHATGTIVTTENFTGSAGTNLTTFGWTLQTGSTGPLVVTDANRIRGNAANQTSVNYANDIPTVADYDVSADLYVASLVPNHYTAIGGRCLTNATTFYFAQYNVESTRWEITEFLNGTTTLLDSLARTLTVGNTYTVYLQFRGTSITLEVDGVALITVVDATLSAAGRGCINVYQDSVADSNTTGIHVDNFQLRQIVDPIPPRRRFVVF